MLRKDNTILKFENRVLNKSNKYNGPFLFLNNFDNIVNGISYSEIGADIIADSNYFRLENSNVFNGEKCLKIYSGYSQKKAVTQEPVSFGYDKITFETYFSNYTSYYVNYAISQVVFLNVQLEVWPEYNKYRVGIACEDYELYNGTSLFTIAGAKYILLPINYSLPCHFAVVFDFTNSDIYIFGNGTLYIKAKLKSSEDVSCSEVYPLRCLNSLLYHVFLVKSRNIISFLFPSAICCYAISI